MSIQIHKNYPLYHDRDPVERPRKVTAYLDWRDRPSDLQYAIYHTFQHLSQQSSSNWGLFNGEEGYSAACL